VSNREIHRLAARPHRLIGEALQGLVVGEIIAPGKRLLIASPWISDVPILDNRSGRFTALNSSWGTRVIRLSAILRTLLERHTEVYLHCGPGGREAAFIKDLSDSARGDGTSQRLHTRQSEHDPDRLLDHQKMIAGDDWAMFGSMNLTYRGVEINGELVTVSTDPARVANVSTELMGLFR
jgi:phosphatidylserine/phosphatidylglycerophosphate/cardiolipin synthase-like enzyme